MYGDFTVYGKDSLDYDLSSFVFTHQWDPLPDGTNVQVCIYPANQFTVEGPKIAAIGETVSLRIVGVDLSTHNVYWSKVDPSQPSTLIGTGETCTFTKTLEVEIIEVIVEPIS